MSDAARYRPHYTVKDFLTWEGDWELWDGIPVAMSPAATPEHQLLGSKMIQMIGAQLKAQADCQHCVVLGEVDWKISSSTIVRPDIVVTCDPLPDKHLLCPPAFIAEILSPSTATKDQTAKRDLYEEFGVKYYAIVNPLEKALSLLELNEHQKYQSCAIEKTRNVTLTLTNCCSISVNFYEIFQLG